MSQRSQFRPDIEGLRAVAVLAVVLFHAAVPGLPGGFVGVDVFFVISGFLITGMLWREVETSGTVRLSRFYGARARRLLPAGITVLIATALASAWLLPPLEARTVLGDGVASALYVGNYRLALRGTDYLAADTAPSTFQHYWSLGVEEQFYLVWPALLMLTAWLAHRSYRRPGAPERARPVRPYLAVLAVVAVVSFAISLRWTQTSPSWAYFSLPTRAWELAVGGLVALTGRWWRHLGRPEAGIAGWVGLALIGVSCLHLGASTPFPGLAALAPVVGAALIIGGGFSAPRWGVGAVLSVAPMRQIGRLSYSWYLWHWPVLLLTPALLGHEANLSERLGAAVISAALAVGTLYVVENPLRFAAPLRRSGARSLAFGLAATAAGVCAGLVALQLVPAPVGQGAAVAAPRIGAPSPAAATAPRENPQDAAVRDLTAQVQSAVAASAGPAAVPSNLTPPLARAAADKQQPFVDGCVLSWTDTRFPNCTYGDPAGPTTVALVGDSHAAQWQPALKATAEQQHWRLHVMSRVTCPLNDLPITSPYLGREFTECERWRSQVIEELRAHPPTLIVLGASRRYGGDFGFVAFDANWVAGLGRTVATLRTIAPVLVLGPVPDPHETVPVCVSQHLDSAAACTPTREVAVNEAGIAAEKAATEAAGGKYADLTQLFCTEAKCPIIVGNTLVFRDDNHITPEYGVVLAPVVSAIVTRALPRG